VVIVLRARGESITRCAVCHDEDALTARRCEGCLTWVHDECRGPRCPTLGCAPRPRVRWRRPVGAEALAAGALDVTLHGLTIALVLLGLLVVFTEPTMGPLTEANVERARVDVQTIARAVYARLASRRVLPPSAHVTLDDVRDQFATDLVDPWGNDYTFDGDVVRSAGPDERFGTDDDITSADPIVGAR
jgi:hypothetical protein